MHAIEFETRLYDGVIELPPSCNHWRDGQPVKVIVLAADGETPLPCNLQRHVGTLTLTEEPLAFQAAMREEWT